MDDDAAALEAADRNARANDVSLDLRPGDALGEVLPETDAVVANVSAAFAARLAPRLGEPALIVSGYLESDQPDPPGYRAELRVVEDGWAADLFRPEE
jgi:ribosomal protein L11 methylase PrmA